VGIKDLEEKNKILVRLHKIMEEGLPNNEKEIHMHMCPRSMISYVVLVAVQAFAGFLLFVRLYIITKISPVWAMIIAIFATFVATAETEVKL